MLLYEYHGGIKRVRVFQLSVVSLSGINSSANIEDNVIEAVALAEIGKHMLDFNVQGHYKYKPCHMLQLIHSTNPINRN